MAYGITSETALARVLRLADPTQLLTGGATPLLASRSGSIILDRIDFMPGDRGLGFDYGGRFEITFTDLAGGEEVTLSGTFDEVPR